MAGGGICVTPDEHARVRKLNRAAMCRFLTEIDEHGWQVARDLLLRMSCRAEFQQPEKTENTQ